MDLDYLQRNATASSAATGMATWAAQPRPPAVLPKGTPLDGDASCLSVLSYNVLAPVFVRPIDLRTGEVQPFAAFQWAEPANEVLDWEARRPRLVAELLRSRADVICLQEVEFSRAGESGDFALPSWLSALEGYAAELPAQGTLQQMAERNKRVLAKEVAVGNAVLFRTDRLERLRTAPRLPSTNTRVALQVQGRQDGPLAHLGPTVFFSVHLDAQTEDKRVDQLAVCLSVVRQAGIRETIIAGDMNTECFSGSCVGAFFAEPGAPPPGAEDWARECASALRLGLASDDDADAAGANGGSGAAKVASAAATVNGSRPTNGQPTESQLEAWRLLWEQAAEARRSQRIDLSRVPTGATRASWDHGKSCGPCVSWRLDHILYTSRTLQLKSAWATLEADPESVAAGMPNHACPSDHLPVAATFVARATPALASAQLEDLTSRLEALEARQTSERQELDALHERLQPPSAPPAASGEEAKGKKQKKDRPSPEMIAFIQDKRKQQRELKARHVQERSEFVGGLGELELDAIQRLCSSTWCETGER
eukprot:TRINITY_DN22740_c0_g1_i2.p1 TRINITY_DN22740_c0_g1~~TRINITY_DN22740_c0_g1_i2.p1  ORF type:complete len:540 (-),score=136.75 TRINITY_DN22740_c0_g1_i2:71-1690(-)